MMKLQFFVSPASLGVLLSALYEAVIIIRSLNFPLPFLTLFSYIYFTLIRSSSFTIGENINFVFCGNINFTAPNLDSYVKD